MRNTSQEFGLFIDNLRSSRNVSREDFVDGILSTRQFQRYLKGGSSISIENIFKLIDGLELDFFTVYNNFLRSSNTDLKIITEVYNHIVALDYKSSYELIQKYSEYDFSSLYYKKLLDLYDIITRHKLLRISTDMAITYIEDAIDYQTCIKSEIFNFSELTALLYITQILKDEKKKKEIMIKLFDILKFHKISDFNIKDGRIVHVYSAFSKLLGSQKKFKEVIFLTKKGIEICESNKTTNSLAHLYYYCALGYLGNSVRDKALQCAKKAFYTLEIENVPLKYDAFIKKFESHFGLSFTEFKTW